MRGWIVVVLVWIVASWAHGALAGESGVWSEKIRNELIVKVDARGSDETQAARISLYSSLPPGTVIQAVNEEEGILRIRVPSSEERDEAQKRLSTNPRVKRISANYSVRPQDPLRVLSDVLEVSIEPGPEDPKNVADLIRAIDRALANRARVIQVAVGVRMPRAIAENHELKEALVRARNAGALLVVAAGNDGIDQDNSFAPVFPSAYGFDNVLSVASTDEDGRILSSANYGPRSVHIGAREISNITRAAEETWAKNPKSDATSIRSRLISSARREHSLRGKVFAGGVLDSEDEVL